MKVVIGALELDPSKVAGSAESVPAEHGPQTDRGRLEKLCDAGHQVQRWTQFFKDYESKIITLCVAMTRDRAIAEDICADTFVRVVSSIDAFRENSSIKTWIYTIARNLCLTHLARAKRTVSFDDEMADAFPDCTPGAEQVVADREADTALQEAIGQLDPSLREALLWCHGRPFLCGNRPSNRSSGRDCSDTGASRTRTAATTSGEGNLMPSDEFYDDLSAGSTVSCRLSGMRKLRPISNLALLAERRSGNSPNSPPFSGAWPLRMHQRTSPTVPCGWCARKRAQRASPDGRTSFQRCSTLDC